MLARSANPYVVTLFHFDLQKYDGDLFGILQQDIIRYDKLAEMAWTDDDGFYRCYFMRDGSLFYGTTLEKPYAVKDVRLSCRRIRYLNEKPTIVTIHAQNYNSVLWLKVP